MKTIIGNIKKIFNLQEIKKYLGIKYLINLSIFIAGFFFLKYALNFPTYYIIILFISYIIIFLLSKKKSKFASLITIILLFLNIGLLIFILIPTYNHNINMNGFYINQKNYLSIEINDSVELLGKSNAKLIISNNDNNDKKIRISNDLSYYIGNENKIELLNNDIIMYNCKSKSLKSIINIHLRDGTIIRMLPQSSINLNDISINKQNIIDSKTKIKVNKGTIRFNIIKTIKNEDSFQLMTENGTLVIRGTSGIIDYDEKNNNTLIYSQNHIIEINNNSGEKEYVSKGEIYKFNNNAIKNETIEKFKQRFVNYEIFKKIEEFNVLDEKLFEYYQNLFNEFIETNFKWEYENNKNIDYLAEIKMRLIKFLSFLPIFEENEINSIENYNKMKALKGKEINIKEVGNNIEGLIITPINNSLKRIKIEYLKGDYLNSLKQKLISIYNLALDSGKQIDINEMKKYIKLAEAENINNIKNIIKEIINKYLIY